MAGGKETPRQKMIGMMYLVLTALLALNVSNAVLEKFAVLNTTLMELRDEATSANLHVLESIKGSTSKTSKVEAAKQQAQAVRDLTAKAIKALDAVKEDLRKEHDGTVMEDEAVILNTNIAEEKMLNPNKNTGKDFENILVNYNNDLAKLTGNVISFPKLNKKAEDYPEFKNNTHHKDKDFLHFMFEGTPTMASITVVTQLQNEILENEGLALDTIAKRAEVAILKVDAYVPMVIPESDIVAAGAKYKARMFMAASSSGIIPTMKARGADLAVAKDEETKLMMGTVEFTASATSFNKDLISEQEYKAEITLKVPDTTITRNIKYKVIKPVIRVTTGNLPQLYYNCGNLVNIEVPSLGTNYQPTFIPKGAKVVPTDNKTKIMIVPKDNKVIIQVNNAGGVPLGSEEFAVKRIPRPHVVKKDQAGREVDPKGQAIATLIQLRISVEPDDTFKENVPKDAVYRVRSMEVLLKRGVQYVATMNTTSEIVDLNSWRAQMHPGDIIVCNIKSVVRQTFLNEVENTDFNGYEFVPLK